MELRCSKLGLSEVLITMSWLCLGTSSWVVARFLFEETDMEGGGGFKEEEGLREGGLECWLPFCEVGPVARLLLP